MSFSKRMGFVPQKILQTDDIDAELRNALWNAFIVFIYSKIKSSSSNRFVDNTLLKNYATFLWSEFYKARVDTISSFCDDCLDVVRKSFYDHEWNELYDFVQFNIEYLSMRQLEEVKTHYINECNRVLERENSAYRIIDDLVVPITNEIEIDEIESAIFNTQYPNVNVHLKTALAKISDKINPDYRNCIKESISAVEALCREITGESTLGQSFKKLESSGIDLHGQFKSALEKLYHYTNDKNTGIRHSLLESGQTPQFEEAKFMLVSCSAFVNYLISKRK